MAEHAIRLEQWIASRPVDEIRKANLARLNLKRRNIKTRSLLSDARYPKGPASPWSNFIKAKLGGTEFSGADRTARFRELAAEYKALTPEERKVCLQILFSPRSREVDVSWPALTCCSPI
jgi:hypothetical protein